jgi:hypothetical protein
MGGKGAEAPDYRGAAEEQAQASAEITNMQTYANRPTQYNPWGKTEWGTEAAIDPATGQSVTKWNQYETLSPDAQRALDAQLGLQAGRSELAGGMLGRSAAEFGEAMDWDKFGSMTGVAPLDTMQDPSMWSDKAYDNTMAMAQRKLDPQFENEKAQMEIKLRNQGLRPGDQAYDDTMGAIDVRQTDAYNTAMMSATDRAGQEAQRMQGMEKTGMGYNQDAMFKQAEFANQLRQQAIKEEMTQRGFSLNEINALISGQQVANPQFESFKSATKSETPQYMQATTQQGNFDQQSAQADNAALGQAAGMAGMMMMSDRRLKRYIKKIGEIFGYSIYSFQYIWGVDAVGVMSDEIPQEFVHKHRTGYDMVDYGRLMEAGNG